jgi:hypothetical protein
MKKKSQRHERGFIKLSRKNDEKKSSKKTEVIKKSSPTKKLDSNLKQDISKVVKESLVEKKGQISFKPSSQKSLVQQVLSADFDNLPRKEIIKNVAYAMLLIMFGSFSLVKFRNTSLIELQSTKETKLKAVVKNGHDKTKEEESMSNSDNKKVKTQNDLSLVSDEIAIPLGEKENGQLKSNPNKTKEEENNETILNGEKESMSNSDHIQLTSLVKKYYYLVPMGTLFVLPLLLQYFSSLSNYIKIKLRSFLKSAPVEENIIPQSYTTFDVTVSKQLLRDHINDLEAEKKQAEDEGNNDKVHYIKDKLHVLKIGDSKAKLEKALAQNLLSTNTIENNDYMFDPFS